TTRWRSRAARRPRGSNSGVASGTLRRASVDAFEEAVDASFGGQQTSFFEKLVATRVAGDEHERELEPAGLYDRKQIVDARRHGSLLPTCDHGSLSAGAFGDLLLSEAGAQARLSNQRGPVAAHRAECTCGARDL